MDGELQAEVDHILSSIQQTAETVQFNTRNLFVQTSPSPTAGFKPHGHYDCQTT
jgi:flagellin-like hook-associated protein FlgL